MSILISKTVFPKSALLLVFMFMSCALEVPTPPESDDLKVFDNFGQKRENSLNFKGSMIFLTDRIGAGGQKLFKLNSDGSGQLFSTTSANEHIFDFSVSPFGTRIAYTSVQDFGDGVKMATIWSISSNGTDRKRLAFGFFQDDRPESTLMPFDPQWSPDGKKIAFTLQVRQYGEVHVMDPDGSNQEKLTDFSGMNAGHQRWSTDGSRIAFILRLGASDLGDLYVMQSNGTNVRQLTHRVHTSSPPVWSPDGSKIAFSAFGEFGNRTYNIYVINADGTNLIRVTNGSFFDSYLPVWSPDGSKIAFTTNTTHSREIYVADADGTDQVRLTYTNTTNRNPKWSPDGTMVAYDANHTGDASIFIIDSDGLNETRLTTDGINTRPEWIK